MHPKEKVSFGLETWVSIGILALWVILILTDPGCKALLVGE